MYGIRPHYESWNAECLNKQLRESISNVLEYCYNGEWRWLCLSANSRWDTNITVAACTQLGFSDSESKLAVVIVVDE